MNPMVNDPGKSIFDLEWRELVLKKYNLEIMTVIFFGMITICSVFSNQLGLVQRIMLGYMFLFTLHEWEETRYPGGFTNLMVKFFGLTANPDKIAAAHIPVAILLIAITVVPFLRSSRFWL